MTTGSNIGYARVSTKDQSTEAQIFALKQHGCERIFFDDGISGVSTERSGLNDALTTLKANDTLIVWKLDRLARSLGFLCNLLDDFADRHIGFISLSDGINTTTNGGRMICQILGAIAEFERNIIIERTHLGIENARQNGKHLGRPRKLTDHDIKSAYDMMRDQNMHIKDVAGIFGVSVQTLRRSVKVCMI